MDNPLTALTTEQLRARRSLKWHHFDPDVLPLWVAEMDVPLAGPIATALSRAVAIGDTGYAHPGRLPEAFARFAHRYGWTPDPAHMVLVPDVVRGLTEVLRLVSEPGDGVVINTPVYPPFFSFIASAERRLVESPLARLDGGEYVLDLDRLDRDLARPEARVYLICNPHNPTGLVLRPDELATIAHLAERHGVRLLVDEIHAPLTYSGVLHTPMATVPAEAAAASIIFVSASKAWNLPGLKAALAVAGGAAGWQALGQLPPEASFGAGLFGVIASEAAFADPDCQAWLAALLAGLDENRRLLADLLAAQLPEVGYVMPDATYLAWLDLRALEFGDDPAQVLLERARVGLSNGPAFGDPGRGHARMNLATSPTLITEAVRRIAETVRPSPPSAL